MEGMNAKAISEQMAQLEAEYKKTDFADDEAGRQAKADFEALMQQLTKLADNFEALTREMNIDKTDA